MSATNHTDTERLDFLIEHHASFGLVGHAEDDGSYTEAVFVRVPCRLMYEWHCFDGADARAALDAAIDGPRCSGGDGACEAPARLWEARRLATATAFAAAQEGA